MQTELQSIGIGLPLEETDYLSLSEMGDPRFLQLYESRDDMIGKNPIQLAGPPLQTIHVENNRLSV